MVAHHRLSRPVRIPLLSSAGSFAACFLISQANLLAQISPLEIEFLPTAKRASAIPAPGGQHIVSVYTDAHKLSKANWLTNGSRKNLNFIGKDKVTRLCFFDNPLPDKRN